MKIEHWWFVDRTQQSSPWYVQWRGFYNETVRLPTVVIARIVDGIDRTTVARLAIGVRMYGCWPMLLLSTQEHIGRFIRAEDAVVFPYHDFVASVNEYSNANNLRGQVAVRPLEDREIEITPSFAVHSRSPGYVVHSSRLIARG